MAQLSTVVCTNCDKVILVQNIDLHSAHCTNNFERCNICTEIVPKRLAKKHYLNTHIPVTCRLCNETVERVNYLDHKGEKCPKRIVECEHCNVRFPAEVLFEHQEVCGNCKKICHKCGRDIRETKRERVAQRSQRHRLHDPSQKRLLFAIVMAGIAAILGSVFIPGKADDQELSYSTRSKE